MEYLLSMNIGSVVIIAATLTLLWVVWMGLTIMNRRFTGIVNDAAYFESEACSHLAQDVNVGKTFHCYLVSCKNSENGAEDKVGVMTFNEERAAESAAKSLKEGKHWQGLVEIVSVEEVDAI